MKVFITGGTGFIGARLAEMLAAENHDINLLVRNPTGAESSGMDKVTVIKGDLFDEEALREGMKECDWVFHMAAYTKPWSKDPSLAFRTNVTGTVNVLEAALKSNVRKVVFTSTGGTMSFSHDGNHVTELTNPDPVFHTIYEKTKAEAEKIAAGYSKRGLDIVIVNPTRVYGPGKLTKSNSLTRIIRLYIAGFWRILPGTGESVGNYVFIDDVVKGHLLAARSGRNGERYILGGENHSFRELFAIIGEAAGKKRVLLRLPGILLKTVIRVAELFSEITGTPPLITMEWFDKYMNNWIMSSEKAIRELGYRITPSRAGIERTVQWLKSQKVGTGE